MYAYGLESEVSSEGDMLPPVPTVTSNVVPVVGVDINGNTFTPDAGQYIPDMTSPTTPFLGDQPGISASESPESVTSPEAVQ